MSDEFERRPMPWLNFMLDWEGVAAAAGAFLAALLLGWIWSPLFWIGFVLMLGALAAGCWSRRSPPDVADGVVAPCDGVVVQGLAAVAESMLTGPSVLVPKVAGGPGGGEGRAAMLWWGRGFWWSRNRLE